PGARIRLPDWHSVERAAGSDGEYANCDNPMGRAEPAQLVRLREQLAACALLSIYSSTSAGGRQAGRIQSQSAAGLHRDATGLQRRLRSRIPAMAAPANFREL